LHNISCGIALGKGVRSTEGEKVLIVRLYKIASWLCCYTPQRIRYTFAAVAGDLYYWLAREHSRKADRNMQIVLGEPKINRRVRLYARRSFRNYAKYMTDFLRQPYLTPEYMNQVTGQTGWEYIEQSLAHGKGLVLITAHYGSWDNAAMLIGLNGHKVSTVANDFNPPELNQLIQGSRRKHGLEIYSPKEALRGLYTTLKKNGIIALLFDSPVEGEGIVVNFFGKPARFPSGPAMIALRTGSKVMIGYVVRQPGNTSYYGFWTPPFDFELTGNREKDLVIMTQTMAEGIEKLVRRHPDQWYMFRKIWLDDAEIAEYLKQEAVVGS